MRPDALKQKLREAALNYARKRSFPIGDSPASAVIFSNLRDSFHPESFEAIAANGEWQARTTKPHSKVAGVLEMQSSNSSDALLMSIFCHPNIGDWKGVRDLLDDSLDQLHFGVKGEVHVNGGQADSTEIDMSLTDTLCEAKLTEVDFCTKPCEVVEGYDGLQESVGNRDTWG